MLKRQRFRHTIAIAGQVKDAITGMGILGAIVKIIDAPNDFIDLVIFKTKLFGLPSLPIQWRSLGSALNPANKNFPKQIQDFQEYLENPKFKVADRLKLFQTILEDAELTNQHKFQAFQRILDHFPPSPKGKISQPDRTQTDSNGWFYFTNLPPGLYHLEAFLPSAEMRYSQAQCQIQIGQEDREKMVNPDQNVSPFDKIMVQLELKPTTLLGKVTSSEEREAIGMAKVEIQGSGDSTFSFGEFTKQKQGEWNYRFVGIEAGNTPLTVIVSARGYPTRQKEISLQTGEVKSLDFQLTAH